MMPGGSLGTYRAILALALAAAVLTPLVGANAQDQPPAPGGPIEITADSLEVRQDQQTAVFSGNVTAIQGEIILRADQVTVHYAVGGGGSTINRIDAQGNVFFSTATETAQGQTGTYDVVNGIITLTGSVVLTTGENVVRGNRLVLNLVAGTSTVEGGPPEDGGRVRGLFVPGNAGR